MFVGIDLGNSNSKIALLGEDSYPILVPDSKQLSQKTTESAVCINKKQSFVGKHAWAYHFIQPEIPVISNFKHYLGKSNKLHWENNGREWTSEGIIAILLKKLIQDVTEFSGKKLSGLTLTIPAYYSESQKRALQLACKLAEAPINSFLEEPLANAVYYSEKFGIKEELALFVDFGGGKTDLSIISIQNKKISLLAIDSISTVSGNAINGLVTDFILNEFKNLYQIEPLINLQQANYLKNKSEKIKLDLFNKKDTTLIEEIISLSGKAMLFQLSSQDFMHQFAESILKIKTGTENLLKSLALEIGDISKIILSGQGSEAPWVVKLFVEQLLVPKTKIVKLATSEPLVMGAALHQRSQLGTSNQEFSFQYQKVSPYHIGIKKKYAQNSPIETLFFKNSPIPSSYSTQIQIPRNLNELEFTVFQFSELTEMQELGTIAVRFDSEIPTMIKIIVEMKAGGTMSMKIYHTSNSREIPFKYKQKVTLDESSILAQKEWLNEMEINAI